METDGILPTAMVVFLLAWPTFALAMAAVASMAPKTPQRSGTGTRHYWIVIPALNEAKVIRQTVTAALALHSDRAPVRVLVVDDGSEDETPLVLRELAHPRLYLIRRDKPEARQGKGAALNAAYRAILDWAVAEDRVDSTIIGVIDGDGQCDRHVIADVVDAYLADPDVGALQCRVRIRNRQRMLGLLQDFEFSCVANASQTFRDLVDSVGMGGNGQFVRLDHLMRFGDTPWSSCLVEDLELGLRLHLAGVRIRYAPEAIVHQQGPLELRRLLKQRTRWAQGNLQCARYLHGLSRSRQVRSLGLLDHLAYLVPPWLAVPMSVIVGGIVVLVVAGMASGNAVGGLVATDRAVPQAVALWAAMVLAPGLVWAGWHRWRIGDEPLLRCLAAGLLYPFFLLLGVVAAWKGLARHLAGRLDWVKTERHDETLQTADRSA